MNTLLIPLLVITFAYLLGSLSSAILVCKWFGLPDPREKGSKNPGATNVLRLSNKKMAFLVLLGDVLKGLLAVLIARLFGLTESMLAWTALAAVIGHIFPVFFNFKGGKGVATALGGILGISWLLTVISLTSWLLMAKIFRYSSLAALTAVTVTPLASLFIIPTATLPLSIMALLIFWTHRENIARLLTGNESKIKF